MQCYAKNTYVSRRMNEMINIPKEYAWMQEKLQVDG